MLKLFGIERDIVTILTSNTLDERSYHARTCIVCGQSESIPKIWLIGRTDFPHECSGLTTEGLLIPIFAGEMPDKEKNRYRDAGLTCSNRSNLGQFNLSTLRKILQLIDHASHRCPSLESLSSSEWLCPSSLRLLRPRLRHYLTDHNSRPQSFAYSYSWLIGTYKKLILGGYSKVLGVSDYILSELKKQAIWRNLGRYYHFVNIGRFQPDERMRLVMRNSQGLSRIICDSGCGTLDPSERSGCRHSCPQGTSRSSRSLGRRRRPGTSLALQRTAESLGVHERT